jgi:acyl-CoA thioester hydrolase
VYGHVNNIIYYSFFDTVVNKFLITRCALDIVKSPIIGLVVHSECEYMRELTYPEVITAGTLHINSTSTCAIAVATSMVHQH